MYLNIVLKLLIGSIVIFIILRLIGKKTSAELTPFDLICFLILGGLLETPLYDPAISIWNTLYALIFWGLWVFLINYIIKKTFFISKALQGEPSVLVSEGKINRQALEENQIDLEQLRAMLRQHGCFSLRDVNYAILEIDGILSVIRKDQPDIPSILLVDEGRIDEATLKSMGRDTEWLLQNLEQEGYSQINEIFYCEWVRGKGFYIESNEKNSSSDVKLDG